MYHVVLYEPEIPPNTGNIIRLCANTGCQLHLIEPLGFTPNHAKLKRAGLDYHDWAAVSIQDSFAAFVDTVQPSRIFTFSTHHTRLYTDPHYCGGEAFVFGPETRGLPREVRESVPKPQRLRLPMQPHNRSLNLSNAVSVVVYEAWRQAGFAGAIDQ